MSKQSDIARQFDLPERQSKLNTMLREEGLRDEQVYCICRSSDVSRFMIGCDNCEEWYHGDCINVTETEANKIRKFFCQGCRLKQPSLEIKYKEKRSHHHKHHKEKEKHREEKSHSHEKHSSFKSKQEKRKDRCGECEACYIREDCGRCEQCKDMPKFGGHGKLKQKCKKRQCQNFFHLAKKHHGLSTSKNEKRAPEPSRNDHSYNSHASSMPKAPSRLSSESKTDLIMTQFTIPVKRLEEKVIKSHTSSSVTSTNSVTTVKSSSNLSATKPSTVSSGTIKVTKDYSGTTLLHDKHDQEVPTILTNVTNRSSIEEIEDKVELDKSSSFSLKKRMDLVEDDDWEPKPKKIWEPHEYKPFKPRKRKEQTVGRKRKPLRDSDSDLDNWTCEVQVPRQCLGPQCARVARLNSKYCSDDCGLELAKARIYSVLPQRIQEWNMTPCKGEENDRKNLEKIRNQQLEARKALQMLDEKHKDLDRLLERSKAVLVDPEVDGDDEVDGTEGAFVYCVTCGHEIPTRKAIKHMHNCYNKLESQMSFGSMFKTRIEGNNMFCDYFNPINHTYCKRLRVMCPEHTKEPKVSTTEVCGFPLTENVFTETKSVCRISKKKCIKHYCWEKLRRACVDMERVRQCLKLDELVEQERQFRLSITNRAGVLGLMLHSTYDHEYAVKLVHQQHRHVDHQYQQQHEKVKNQPLNDEKKNHPKDTQNQPKENQSPPKDCLYQPKDHQYSSKKLHSSSTGKEDNTYFSDHHYHRQDLGNLEASKHSSKSKLQSKLLSSKSSQQVNSGRTPEPTSPSLNAYRPSSLGDNSGGGTTTHHDHLYFSSHQNKQPDNKKLQDHLYYSNKKHK